MLDPAEVWVQVRLDQAIVRDMQMMERKQGPDLPGRVIAATTLHFDMPVINRERKIRSSNLEAIW